MRSWQGSLAKSRKQVFRCWSFREIMISIILMQLSILEMKKTAADSVTPEEFYDIYHMYGYDRAISRDSASLSYVYQLDERNRLLMLDSCQYEPENLVEGRIKAETLVWMDEQLKKPRKMGCRYCLLPTTTFLPRAVCTPPSVLWIITGKLSIFFRNIKFPCF